MPTPPRSPQVSSVPARLSRSRAAQDIAQGPEAGPSAVSLPQRMEVLGRLAGRFSHEFNNQLGVISNSAYLIQRKIRDPLLTESAQAMLRSVEVASGLTQRLQRLGSRHSSGAQPLELQPWLNALLPALAMVLGKRMDLALRPVAPGLWVHLAPDELELALTSMLLWVRDVLPEGGAVTVEARRMPEGPWPLPTGAYVQLGIEAAADGVQRLGEPSRAAADACQAWGLGLAHSLGCSAGGGLWVAAEPGRSLCARLVVAQLPGR